MDPLTCDTLAAENRAQLFIDGAWVAPAGGGTIEVVNPATEEVMGRIPEGTPEDIDRAVRAARKAFPAWAATDREDRAKYLQRISEGLPARHGEIAQLITREMGMSISLSAFLQVGEVVRELTDGAELLLRSALP